MENSISREFAFENSADATMYFKKLLMDMVLEGVTISPDIENYQSPGIDISLKFTGNLTAIRQILSDRWFTELKDDKEWELALKNA